MIADVKKPKTTDDSKLVNACKRGDTSAFEQLVNRYQNRMLNIAFRITGNYDDACDITQDAFLSAWRKIADFRGDALFSTWLTSIVINLSRNRLQQISSNNSKESFSLDSEITGTEGSIKHDAASNNPTALELMEEAELRSFIESCIRTLPVEFREVLVLRDMQELAYEEICGALGLKDGTVKSRLFRAREGVRDCVRSAMGMA